MANKFYLLLIALALADKVNIDDQSLVKIQPSSTLTLELTSNPSTGYSWTARDPASNKVSIKDLSGTYVSPSKNSPPGTAGVQLFDVTCNEKCLIGDSFFLYFDLKRPWEENPIETKTITLQVTS